MAALSDYKTEVFSDAGCGRRGILGACSGSAAPQRDNTAAEEAALAKAGAERAKEVKATMIDEESPLVMRLRKQTAENAEKNREQVELEMFANSQSGEFGPFSRYVPVKMSNGEFVLVRVPEYERLKRAKKVKNQQFVDDADAKKYKTERTSPTVDEELEGD